VSRTPGLPPVAATTADATPARPPMTPWVVMPARAIRTRWSLRGSRQPSVTSQKKAGVR
jgi:hypothetical protein